MGSHIPLGARCGKEEVHVICSYGERSDWSGSMDRKLRPPVRFANYESELDWTVIYLRYQRCAPQSFVPAVHTIWWGGVLHCNRKLRPPTAGAKICIFDGMHVFAPAVHLTS